VVGLILSFACSAMAETGQYNMSLQDKVITGAKGELASPQAVSVTVLVQGVHYQRCLRRTIFH
jgi:hypothetical protein